MRAAARILRTYGGPQKKHYSGGSFLRIPPRRQFERNRVEPSAAPDWPLISGGPLGTAGRPLLERSVSRPRRSHETLSHVVRGSLGREETPPWRRTALGAGVVGRQSQGSQVAAETRRAGSAADGAGTAVEGSRKRGPTRSSHAVGPAAVGRHQLHQAHGAPRDETRVAGSIDDSTQRDGLAISSGSRPRSASARARGSSAPSRPSSASTGSTLRRSSRAARNLREAGGPGPVGTPVRVSFVGDHDAIVRGRSTCSG